MPKISFLSEEIRSKIAAGEVIERPASVVKELVENALDAKASYIRIAIREGGIREIQVYDDGEGMEPEDLRICYKHFATSKIKELSDIFRISTLGFRGEALASIAQVSKLIMMSKTLEQEVGFQVEVEGGKEVNFKPVNLKKGTLVVVRDLFYNLPARKAFLKSPKVETQKILEMVRGLSLVSPEVRYEVKNLDEKEKNLFCWEGGEVTGLLFNITGIEERHFKRLSCEISPYEVELVLTDTAHAFPHTRYLYVLVNRRWVRDERLNRLILSIIKPFYGNLGFPAGIISIRIPYHLIDVNVHPAKWEVKFKDEKRLSQALSSAFGKFFAKRSYFYPSLREKTEQTIKTREDIPLECFSHRGQGPSIEINHLVFSSFERHRDFSFIGIFAKNYILVEKEEKLYVIDQHALSERIMYEKLLKTFEPSLSQTLIFPQILNISPEDPGIQEKLEVLKSLGFELEPLENRLILKRVPASFDEGVKEVLEEVLVNEFDDPRLIKQAILARYACKLAKKKGEISSDPDTLEMIQKFFSLDLKTCPHGRPTYFVISLSEIEKKLKRQS